MRNYKHRHDMVQVRVQGNSSYQIKRAIEAIGRDKGYEMMSRSGIKKNTGGGPRFREFVSFKDLKEEKKATNKDYRKQ